MFGSRTNYQIALIFALLCLWEVQALHNQKVMAMVGEVGCQIVGCKVCFKPEVCLLCDTDYYFQAEPIENTCLCQ